MSDAALILNKWIGSKGWSEDSKIEVLLSFIDELGPEAIGLLDRHLAKVNGQENDMTPVSTPSVQAEARSDDGVHEVTFDAAPWFAQASDEDIRALAKSDWGGDYMADAVAEFFDQKNDGVTALFNHVNREHTGFECYVDERQALAWLKENRPALHAELVSWAGKEAARGKQEPDLGR